MTILARVVTHVGVWAPVVRVLYLPMSQRGILRVVQGWKPASVALLPASAPEDAS